MPSPTEPSALPLAGTKVVDISNFLAAPMASMFLADFGADVIKVERPQAGDEVRRWGEVKDGVGLYYKAVNRGKRSVTADLRTPFGVEVVKRLVRTSWSRTTGRARSRSGTSAPTCSWR
jgi:formyl-CoA transferase